MGYQESRLKALNDLARRLEFSFRGYTCDFCEETAVENLGGDLVCFAHLAELSELEDAEFQRLVWG